MSEQDVLLGMASRLELPHAPRVVGVAFLLYLALGHLPALFAWPAGLGDIAAGIAAPLVARRLAQGTGRRAALWFSAFGMTDLVVALTLGALTGFQLLNVTPSSAPISELPLALIPTATVPVFSSCTSRPCPRWSGLRGHHYSPPARSLPRRNYRTRLDPRLEPGVIPARRRRCPIPIGGRRAASVMSR